jgi:hypothetical protein
MPPEKIQSDENQSDLTSVNSDNKSKSNAKVPGFEDNRLEAANAKALKEQLAKKGPARAGTAQMSKEKEFINDPVNFLKSNQLLPLFFEGILKSYEVDGGFSALQELSNFLLAQKGLIKNFFFTEHKKGKKTQYLITPFLEDINPKSLPGEESIQVGNFNKTRNYRKTLASLKRIGSKNEDALIRAALIPYDSTIGSNMRGPGEEYVNMGVNLSTDADQMDDEDTPRFAFTDVMNGCSLAVRRNDDDTITAWHYPSPGETAMRREAWEKFKNKAEVQEGDTWDYKDYGPTLKDKEMFYHTTTTIMIRDKKTGSWKINTQTSVIDSKYAGLLTAKGNKALRREDYLELAKTSFKFLHTNEKRVLNDGDEIK